MLLGSITPCQALELAVATLLLRGGGTQKQPGLSASQNLENLTFGQENEADFLSPSQVRHD